MSIHEITVRKAKVEYKKAITSEKSSVEFEETSILNQLLLFYMSDKGSTKNLKSKIKLLKVNNSYSLNNINFYFKL